MSLTSLQRIHPNPEKDPKLEKRVITKINDTSEKRLVLICGSNEKFNIEYFGMEALDGISDDWSEHLVYHKNEKDKCVRYGSNFLIKERENDYLIAIPKSHGGGTHMLEKEQLLASIVDEENPPAPFKGDWSITEYHLEISYGNHDYSKPVILPKELVRKYLITKEKIKSEE